MKIGTVKTRTAQGSQGGFTFIEVLFAAALLAVTLMTLGQLWVFGFNMTTRNDDTGVAYQLARIAVEQTKEIGFYNAPEGTVTTYYDVQENVVTGVSVACRYSVVVAITSSSTVAGSSPVAPSNTALRTVIVTVTDTQTGTMLYQTGTYLVRSGV